MMVAVLFGAGLSACDDGTTQQADGANRTEIQGVTFDVAPPEDAVSEALPDVVAQDCVFDTFIGQTYTPELFGDIGSRPVRVLKPDGVATMDFVPERINVITEQDTDVITAIRCG